MVLYLAYATLISTFYYYYFYYYCLLVIFMSPQKSEPIEMTIGGHIRVCPKNRILDGVPMPQNMGNFGVVRPIEMHCESLLQCMKQKINNGISITVAADCIAPDWPISQ